MSSVAISTLVNKMTRSTGECFHSLFAFTSFSITRWKHRERFFLLLLQNTATKKRQTTWNFLRSSKLKFSFLASSLRQQLVVHVVLCFFRVIKHGFKPISARICFGLFSNNKRSDDRLCCLTAASYTLRQEI